jgi:hypothetical protein
MKGPLDGVGVATDTSLCLPFPIRHGVLGQIVVPRDLTQQEADRLCSFVMQFADVGR